MWGVGEQGRKVRRWVKTRKMLAASRKGAEALDVSRRDVFLQMGKTGGPALPFGTLDMPGCPREGI